MRIQLPILATALCVARVAAADPIPTEISDLTARVSYARSADGVLRVGIAIANPTDKPVAVNRAVRFDAIYIVDPIAKQKHFALKDSHNIVIGGPESDLADGGRWFPDVAPHGETLLWAMFPAPPAGRTFDLYVPRLAVFDGLAVDGSVPGTTVPCVIQPMTAKVTSAKRAGDRLTVIVDVDNPGKQHAGPSSHIDYRDVYVLDAAGRKRYQIVTDTDGMLLASPVSDKNHGGRWFASLDAGKTARLHLVFEAPPAGVDRIDLIIPSFAPLEAIAISGAGTATDRGAPVTGVSKDLSAALRDLGAEVTDRGIAVQLSADLLFAFDRAELAPAASPALEQVAKVLRAYPDAEVTIEGHADGLGSAAHNQPLSERRAQAVAAWLARAPGLAKAHVTTHGWGSTRPIAPNTTATGADDPAGRAKNRRVEIFVKTS